LVDLSLSMSARDINPSRIERTKLELLDLVERLDKTRMGLIVYAAQPHLLIPPTSDKNLLRYYIKLLRTRLLPSEGSSLFQAVHFGIDLFAKQSAMDKQKNHRAILLITDGEANLPASKINQQLDLLAANLKQANIQLYALGIGTLQGAPLLSDTKGWLKFDGHPVVSRLNQNLLTKLANTGNGKYISVKDDDSDWQLLYNQGIGKLAIQSDTQKQNQRVRWVEYYQGYILLSVFLFFLSLSRPGNKRLSSTRISTLLLLLLTFIMISPQAVHADNKSNYRLGYSKFMDGDYQAARQAFAGVDGYAGRFAEGSMAYQLKQYQQAIPLFIQATLDASTDQQRIQAIFNLANCYFKLQYYPEAERLYQDVLRYQPNNTAAQTNLRIAIALKKQARDNEQIVAQRQGKGPRSADAPDNMDITTGKVTLGDTESISENKPYPHSQALRPDQSEQALEHSAPASEKIDLYKDKSWTYDISSLSQLKQLNPKITTDEAILWKRLFEFEENYEAAQQQPNVLPGIKPW
ncbi:MAG: VWA domain-containing protein, partial [Thioalkalispiraceae bacterium]